MRDILRWMLRWFNAGAAVQTVDYIVEADIEIRRLASADVYIRLTATADSEL